MFHWRPTALVIATLATLGLGAWGCFGLTKHLIVTLDKWGEAAPQAKSIDGLVTKASALIDGGTKTLANVNRPCKGPAGPDACGTLAQINKVAIDTGNAVITTQMQVRAVTPLMAAAAISLQTASAHINSTADAATGLLNTATGSIAAAQPLLQSSTRTVDSLNARITDPHIDALMLHLDGVTASADGILGDGRKVADKATNDYMTPKPWYLKLRQYAGDTYDFGALFARHIP